MHGFQDARLAAAALAASTLAAFTLPATAAVVGHVETFDLDTDNWQQGTTSTTVVHGAAGGNPGGYLELRKILGGFSDIAAQNVTDPEVLGDYGAAGVSEVTVDLNMFNSSVEGAYVRFRRNASENGWLYGFGPINPDGNQWSTYSTGFFDASWTDAEARLAGWVTDDDLSPAVDPSPSFADVMAGVGRASVRFATAPSDSVLIGVDNYRLVPEPASWMLSGLVAAAVLRRRR